MSSRRASDFMRFGLTAGALALSLSPSDAAGPCGGPENACAAPLGTYFVAQPETLSDAPRPAVLFFHGGGGWGSRIFTMRAEMTADFTRRGYVVLAPNGMKRPGSRFGPGWSFIPQFPPVRDEAAFTREILADAAKRFNVDPGRVLMAGYSIGGSLTTYLACSDPSLAAAYAPVAGGFWRPQPEDCAGPVKLLHTHGWRDQTVPLEGRPLRNGVEQGDIHATLAQWRTENHCTRYRADAFITDGPFWRRIWTHCAPGTALEFALHSGGHEVPKAWANLAMDWFEKVMAEPKNTN